MWSKFNCTNGDSFIWSAFNMSADNINRLFANGKSKRIIKILFNSKIIYDNIYLLTIGS